MAYTIQFISKMKQLSIKQRNLLLIRSGLSIILVFSLMIKFNFYTSSHIGISHIDMFNILITILYLVIIWAKKPFFWYLGILLFSVGIYYSLEYEIYHTSSNIPPIVPGSEIYYFLQEVKFSKILCNLAHYFPYFCFVIFLFLFIFNKSIKKYYRVI